MAEEQKNAGAPSQPKKQAVKKTAPATTTTQAVKKGEEVSRTGKVKKWFKEMKSELKKVVWPTGKQTMNNTVIVIVCCIVVGLCIWLFDWLASSVISALLALFGKS